MYPDTFSKLQKDGEDEMKAQLGKQASCHPYSTNAW
jgi:hypothetical protein